MARTDACKDAPGCGGILSLSDDRLANVVDGVVVM